MSEPRILNAENMRRVDYLRELQRVFDIWIRPSGLFRRRPSPHQIAEYCEVLSRARSSLWVGVFNQFPECRTGDHWVGPLYEVNEGKVPA